jgi:hypothetical protein
VIDRDTIDRFRRRGSDSVSPRPRPAPPAVREPARRVERTPPRVPERRATPPPRPVRRDADDGPRIRRGGSSGRERFVPSGEDVRRRRDRGRSSLETENLPE